MIDYHNNMHQKVSTYEPYIDGLRALAVLPVIFFHAGFSSFQGGFVGVDIFFVISGYLITLLIIREENHDISLLINFYDRRVRRILPALTFVIIVTIPFSFFLMTPEMLKSYGNGLISVSLFVSNFFFWNTSNYFEISNEYNPLIHTWSLSVEEQFYIFFPLLIILIYKINKKLLLPAIIAIFLISLIFSQFSGNLSKSYPYISFENLLINQSKYSSFYLPFGRIWELLTGTLIAYNKIYGLKKFNSHLSELMSLLGFAFIIYAILNYNHNTPFPSFYTLLPVIGTSFLIIFTPSSSIAKNILSTKVLVGIGLISFSAYLWHQPILSFYKILYVEKINNTQVIFLILFSFFVAFMSWKFIERPFRNRSKIKSKLVIFLFLTSSIFIIFIGYLFVKNDGFKDRYNELELSLIEPDYTFSGCSLNKVIGSPEIKECSFGDVNANEAIVLYGDSHATILFNELDTKLKEKKIKGLFLKNDNCKRFYHNNCIKSLNQIKSHLNKFAIKKIILSFRWPMRIQENFIFDVNSSKYLNTSNAYNKLNNKYLSNFLRGFETFNDKVVIILSYPEYYDPKIINQKNILFGDIEDIYFESEIYSNTFQFYNKLIKDIALTFNYDSLDPSNIFCNTYKNNHCLIQKEYELLYSDTNHLSNKGAKMVIDSLFLKFKL